MARVRFRVEGLRELEKALGELPKATGRNVLRRVLKEAGEPMAAAARARAPFEFRNLIESVDVSTRLTRRQRSKHDKKSAVEMFVGPGPNPQAITQEFGTYFHPAQPFMRPAFDAEKRNALHIITHRLWVEIEAAAERQARKTARLARKR